MWDRKFRERLRNSTPTSIPVCIKGDVVALIDPALFKGALLQTTADLKNAEANREAARANLEKAKAALVQTRADYDRAVGLNKDGVVSQQQLDLATSNYDGANASA